MSAIHTVHGFGQSLWYDNIQRRLLENGELARMIERGEIRGVTSNPAIFHHAITRSTDYDASLVPMAWAGWSAEEIFYQLAVEDIRAAAALLRPIYDETQGIDGYVSLEVSPFLANDTAGTLAEVKRLWEWVARPNLMIKIPATKAGLSAISQAVEAGINVNVTLIFSLQRYSEVMDAYLQGLEQRVAAGLPIQLIASVASFFVSRVDFAIDAHLQEIGRLAGPYSEHAALLPGKAAIANARLAYSLFKDSFGTDRFYRLAVLGARVQRLLWASTSTKNLAYRDVMYVEELIGQDTVNSVPPQTLDAFRDHGAARVSLEEDLPGMRQVLADLESLGISIDGVTAQLEVEGIQAFSDAYTDLIQAVDDRRRAAVADLGPLVGQIPGRVRKLAEIDFPRRLWAHDPSLWAEDSAGQAEVRKRMGWLEAPGRSRGLRLDLARLVKDVQAAGYTHAVLLGMGGLSLAPEVLGQVFGSREIYGKSALEMIILDSANPGQVRAAARWSAVEKTLYIVASKSGVPVETHALLEYFWLRARHKLGEKTGEHFVAVTDPGTPLEKSARERKFRKVFLADPYAWGSNSALTAFGLVPAAVLGIDVSQLLDRAAWMGHQCADHLPAGRNPALVLGAVLGEAALQGCDKLTFIADPPVEAFGAWLEHLVAESVVGILPVDLEPPLPAKKYAADRLFIYLRCGGEDDARASQLRAASQPVLTFDIQNPYDLGAEFFRWEVATAVACAILGVKSFDQLDVQNSKDRIANKVEAFQHHRSLDEGQPVWEGQGGYVFGWNFPGLNSSRTLADVVKAFIAQAHEQDSIAINAYVPRNPRMLNNLQGLRAKILKTSGRATTLRFGPRCLYSTGQLHKDCGNQGLFLQITQQSSTDIEIPGQGLSFGILERAQALGDLETLRSCGKRAIRIHLVDADINNL